MHAQEACNKGDLSTADSLLSQLKVRCSSAAVGSSPPLLKWWHGPDDSSGHPHPSAVGQWLDSLGTRLKTTKHF